MELLFGVVSVAARPEKGHALKMAERAQELGFSTVETIEHEAFTICTARQAKQSPCERTYDAGPVALAWVGHLVGNDLALWPAAKTVSSYLANMDFVPDRLDGLYSFCAADKVGKRITIGTDRYGFWPLYYEHSGDDLLFSTSMALLMSVAISGRRLNEDAMAEFLNFHYCLGDKTFIQSISRLPQGHLLRLDWPDGILSIEQYFDYGDLPAPVQVPSKSVIDDLVSLFLEGVRRRIGHDKTSVCLLSGGFDSRAIACALSYLGTTHRTLTTHGDNGLMDDPDSARWVADALDVPNEYIPLPSDYLQRHWRERSELIDSSTTMHSWLCHLSKTHRFPGAANYDGIAGGVVLNGAFVRQEDLALLAHGADRKLQTALLNRHRLGPALSRAISDRYRETFETHVRRTMSEEWGKVRNHGNAISHFVLRNRTRRAISSAPLQLLAQRLHILAPFLDHLFFEAVMRIDPIAKTESQLYRSFLSCLAPDIARIPSAHDATWPAEFRRRRVEKKALQNCDALRSYLGEIETNRHCFPGLVDEDWFSCVRMTEQCRSDEHLRYLREAQALGELFHWLGKYHTDAA